MTITHYHTTKRSLICIALIILAGYLEGAQVQHVLTRDHAILAATHVYPKWNKPAFTPGPQIVTSLWLVIISHSTEGRRLNWPGWLGEILRWFIHPKMVTHPGCGESNSRPLSCKSDALTRRQSHYSTGHNVVHNLLFNFVAQLQIDKLENF